jgi:hypothetical protein
MRTPQMHGRHLKRLCIPRKTKKKAVHPPQTRSCDGITIAMFQKQFAIPVPPDLYCVRL